MMMKTNIAVMTVLCVLLGGPLHAEEPVDIPDPDLKAALESDLGIMNPTASDMATLTSFECNDDIEDLSGLGYAHNLETLDISSNRITDISELADLSDLTELIIYSNDIRDLGPIRYLTNLITLDLSRNRITNISALSWLEHLENLDLDYNTIADLSPLADLEQLVYLDIDGNHIIDMSPLAACTQLEELWINTNQISTISTVRSLPNLKRVDLSSNAIVDISALTNHAHLTLLRLGNNPLDSRSCTTLGHLLNNNPGLDLRHDACTASLPLSKTLYVNDDAKNDPEPNNALISDPQEDGSRAHPFNSIQEGINATLDGDTLLVFPGIYYEQLNLSGRQITVEALYEDQIPSQSIGQAIINANGQGTALTFDQGEGSNCLVKGFIITNGRDAQCSAILCSQSSPSLVNCLIVGNRADDPNGAAIRCWAGNPVFDFCTIADNIGGANHAGFRLHQSNPTLFRSIIWDNQSHEIVALEASTPVVTDCVIKYGWPGPGNSNVNPLFAAQAYWEHATDPQTSIPLPESTAVWMPGDYHLMSRAGRWDLQKRMWMRDDQSSPCIDMGDALLDIGDEPMPNGRVINIGAYGGTVHASKTHRIASSSGIFDDDDLTLGVADNLWIDNPSFDDLLSLTTLNYPESEIENLHGLEHAPHLHFIRLPYNHINDISGIANLAYLAHLEINDNEITNLNPLSRLTTLIHLDLHANRIKDISVLSSLTKLEYLSLRHNRISDITSLKFITQLTYLHLRDNEIMDISPLSHMTHLEMLDVLDNPLNEEAYATVLPAILKNNPGIDLRHDPPPHSE